MQWLNTVVDEVMARHPDGEILVESGGSPSGTYHLGHMRELIICDAIMLELHRRGRAARHVYFVDDFDVFRKVPANVDTSFEQYLGMPLCDVPSPSGETNQTYADYFLQGLIDSCASLRIQVEFIRSSPKYRSGWFVDAIERCLQDIPTIKDALERISNRKLDPQWTPIQILETGRLKNRQFVRLDADAKTVTYVNAAGDSAVARYDRGEVKLDWRLDWPARWWKLGVHVEPFGREHASAGGSYDTGVELMKLVYKAPPPLPVGYDSIHMAGDTKKMSASKGTAISAVEAVQIMPAEVVRFLILRSPLNRPVYFDPSEGVVKLIDEFAALLEKPDKAPWEQELLAIASSGGQTVVSGVPFSHLVASYQAALRDVDTTLDIIARTEYASIAVKQRSIIVDELMFINTWLDRRAPSDVVFALREDVEPGAFSQQQRTFFGALAEQIRQAPVTADGQYFHELIYSFKSDNFGPKQLFQSLYQLIIGQDSGPRAGWFLSILPREWLLQRLDQIK